MEPLTITLTLVGVGLLGRFLIGLLFLMTLMSVLYGAFCFAWFVSTFFIRH